MMKIVIVALVLCVVIGDARAQSASDVSACRGDAIKVCEATIADLWNYDRVAKCMRKNKSLLSPQCRKVLDAHGL